MTAVVIDVEDPQTLELWTAVGELVDRLPGEWVLIGGLMVQLLAFEHGIGSLRVTTDIDVLGEARPQGALMAISQALLADGFEAENPDPDGYVYRYLRDRLVVDVLAPDGMKPPAKLGGRKAIGVPGGTQALRRAETVTVTVGDSVFSLRRPSLLGAILIKARSLQKHADPESQREDLLRLLAMIEDPRETATDLRSSERGWLREAEGRLDFEASSSLDGAMVDRAHQAYRILIG